MAENTIKTRLQMKNDTEANWDKATNFIPKQGEVIVYNTDETHDAPRVKIGDGVNNVKNLPFIDGFDINGEEGQIVGFNSDGKATAIDFPAIGGEQILRGTKDIPLYGSEGPYWRVGKWNYTGDAVFSVTDAPNPGIINGARDTITQTKVPLQKDRTYTISCYARNPSGASNVTVTFSVMNSVSKTVFPNTTRWEKYSYTFTCLLDNPDVTFGIGSKAEICGMKLELGEIATDWSPALDDMKLVGDVGQLVGFDENGELTAIEPEELNIGGTQLLNNTADPSLIQNPDNIDMYEAGIWGVDIEANKTCSKITIVNPPVTEIKTGFRMINNGADSFPLSAFMKSIPVEPHKKYTFSLYARGTARKLYCYPPAMSTIEGLDGIQDFDFNNINEWIKVTGTFTTKEASTIDLYISIAKDSNVEVCGMKLEVGNVATSWSPSPKDMTPVLYGSKGDATDGAMTQKATSDAINAITASSIGAVKKTGDTMTGTLTIDNATLQVNGYMYPTVRFDARDSSQEITNRSGFEGNYNGSASLWSSDSADLQEARRMIRINTKKKSSTLDNALQFVDMSNSVTTDYRIFHSGMETPVPVENGGTGANNAASARAKLGAASLYTLFDGDVALTKGGNTATLTESVVNGQILILRINSHHTMITVSGPSGSFMSRFGFIVPEGNGATIYTGSFNYGTNDKTMSIGDLRIVTISSTGAITVNTTSGSVSLYNVYRLVK